MGTGSGFAESASTSRRSPVAKHTKQDHIANDTALQQGIDQKYPGTTWVVGQDSYTTAQVDAVLQKRIAANKASDLAHAAWLAACATATSTMEQTAPVVHAVEQRIRAECNNDTGALAVFGLKPVKKGKKSAQVKAQAAEKSAATRKKNNTMGAAQRKTADKVAEQSAVVPANAGQAQEAPQAPAVAPAPAVPALAGQAQSKQ